MSRLPALLAAALAGCQPAPTPDAADVAVAGVTPTIEARGAAPAPPPGMAWIPGGEFSMGAADARGHAGHAGVDQDALPVHRVQLDGFFIDRSEVTNAEFARFVAATGHVTVAERVPQGPAVAGIDPQLLVPGSIVFDAPAGPVPLDDEGRWWAFVPGADWRHPLGPDSSLEGLERHPVVHVAFADAEAHCAWAGKRLPSEAEWEFAARGGLAGRAYPWGDALQPAGRWMGNTFQGRFPDADSAADGYRATAPVGGYAANGYGLFDVAGNVWEWTSDWYRPDTYAARAAGPQPVRNPAGPPAPADPAAAEARRVLRGGSFLCAPEYCARYRVGTRGKSEVDGSSNHVGFRCAADAVTMAAGVPG